jgi:RHO1 GDP-GTP exchange protein 1/2
MSMSAASSATVLRRTSVASTRPPIPRMKRNSELQVSRSRTPIVYPALLSRVAEAFRERIQLGDRLKDGLTYKDAFDGREAVDKIAYIIKTTDRNLALLLGRALDAQKFFHDVTYDHRLRDSPGELYQFRSRVSPFVSGESASPNGEGDGSENGGMSAVKESDTGPRSAGSHSTDAKESLASPSPGPVDSPTLAHKGSVSSDDVPLPSGVFTLLTDCYSPTCTRDSLCYSIACPRRLEQQARLNMKPQHVLKKQISKESLDDFVVSYCPTWRSFP